MDESRNKTFNDTLSDTGQQQLLAEAGLRECRQAFADHFTYNTLTADPVYTCSRTDAGQCNLSLINASEDVAALVNSFS